MGRPKKEVAAEEPKQGVNQIYEFTPSRDEFIRQTSVALILEMTKVSGKVNTDYPDIVVERATALADRLGLGAKVIPVKKNKLTNLVESMQDEGDLD